uniref:uncharacterized protein LOC122609188 n=1 Tax=Erigeron canadensis TaxID=72917 RepID=UPI001CB8C54D|nr:uncharacterized protein LOC122609188 [Erigeron canadensis]
MINVYAPQDESAKRDAWRFLSSYISSCDSNVIVFGDFNSIQNSSERIGSNFSQCNADCFNSFIRDNDLVDILLGGYKFTRVGASSAAKLDRFLISRQIGTNMGNHLAIVLDRNVSDHHPILLFQKTLDFGPIPFKVFNSWSRLRLKHLKAAIKDWLHAKNNGNEIVDLKAKLVELDHAFDSGMIDDNYAADRKEVVHDIMEAGLRAALDIKQKSRINWSVETDENSRFFHSYVNKSRKSLAIQGIKVEGVWMDWLTDVKQAFYDHFTSSFKRQPCLQLVNRNNRFKSLSQDQVMFLERKTNET